MANSKLTISSSLPSSGHDVSQPQSTANLAHTSRNTSKIQLLVKRQNVGSLICRHCPYRSNSPQMLDLHQHLQHSTNPSYKCSFCTYTAKSTSLIINHIKLAHPEKKDNKVFKVMLVDQKNVSAPKKAVTPAKANGKAVTKNETNGIKVKPAGEKRAPPAKTPPKQPKLNNTPPKVVEVQVNDIAKEITEFGAIQKETEDESKLWCICRQPYGKRFMVCCDGCDDWYHGSCVSITPAQNNQMNADCVKWFCPHCARKNSIINHPAEVIQAVTSLSTQCQETSFQNPVPPKMSPQEDSQSDEPPNLNEDLPSNEIEAPSSPPDIEFDRETLLKEEMVCRMEIEKLTEDIRLAHEVLVKKANILKENEGPAMLLSRAKRTEELRRTIKQLEMKDRGFSLERSVLIEFKERGQQRLKELTSQKIQLKKELKPLKEVSVNKKIKLELSSSNTSVIGEMIEQKETLLYNVKVKLLDILKEDNDFTARIRVVEEELADNSQKVEQMRAELDSLQHKPADDGLPSSNALQIKNLKKMQRDRIMELSRLKKRLAQISCGFVIEEIDRKEEEALKTLDDFDKN